MVSADIQGQIDIEAANAAVADAMKQDDIDTQAVRNALGRILGGEASPVAAINSGKSADQMLTVYNRWDGRAHRMPRYQVPKTLTARFQNDIDSFPPQVIGQIAWTLEPEKAGELKREFGPETFDLGLPCYFSPIQDDPQIVADVKGARVPFFCRKGKRLPGGEIEYVRFTDAMALEAHLRKHQRAYPVFTKFRDDRRAREREAAEQQNTAAIATILAQFMQQNGGAVPTAATTPPSASPLPAQAEAPQTSGVETFTASTAEPLPQGEFLPEMIPCDVEGCDFESKSNAGLAAHKRGAHPEG